ncbi:MAG: metallophosphoesterase [Nitrososphaeraceae archaeon]
MRSRKYNFNFQFIFIISSLSILLIFQVNIDLDLNSQFFKNIGAIEINTNKNNDNDDDNDKLEDLNQFDYIFNPRDYYEEDNVAQNTNTKNSTIKEDEVKTYNNYTQNNNKKTSNQNNTNNNNEKINNQSITQSIDDINTTNPNAFNFVAVGDWDCTSETKDTVDNIIDQDPELVLALGDLSYNGKAKCWLKIIEPFEEKTKIVMGNHEVENSKILRDYMDYFGLEKQYYSFDYENVHFLALSTEIPYDEDSQQYEFAVKDLEKYSKDPSIDWIVVFYHRQLYSSGGGPEDEEDFREVYHPLFDKYKVDLALQGHHHVYERIYPITFNDDDENEPVIKDENPNIYNNTEGTIFITVGTGGAHDMQLSKSKPFSAIGIDREFGVLNIAVEKNIEKGNILTGTFRENENDQDVLDRFQLIKNKKE